MDLYHCPDARSFRPLWQMEEMQLPYTLHRMAFPPRSRCPEYLAINPLGTVPLLVDGSTRLTESAAILEYLAVKHGPTPLLVAPEEADYGAWLNWMHFGEATLATPQAATLAYAYFRPEGLRKLDVAEDYRDLFFTHLKAVEAILADGREHLCAGRFTCADISVGYALLMTRFHGVENLLPAIIAAYWGRLQQRPGYRAARIAQKPPVA